MNKGLFQTTSALRGVACPYLGHTEARHSPFARPINSHRCFRYKDDGEVISYRHQAQFCLNSDWGSCYKLQSNFVLAQEIQTIPIPKPKRSTSSTDTPTQEKQHSLSMAAERMLSHTARGSEKAKLLSATSAISVKQAKKRVSSPVPPITESDWQVPILWMFVIIPAILLFVVIGLLGFVGLSGAEVVTSQSEASQEEMLEPTASNNSSILVEFDEPTPSATFIPLFEVVGASATPPPINLALIPTPFVRANQEKDKDKHNEENKLENKQEDEQLEVVRPLAWPYKPASGVPDRIRAPRVGIDAPVIPVGSYLRDINGLTIRFYNVAEYAAGWHDNSSLPGFRGNVVLAGHHNKAGRVFQNAIDLELGDIIFLDIDDNTYSYLVARKEILPETNVSDEQRNENGRWIAQTEDERLTLVTCYPPDGNSQRLIIVAVPVK